jgi:hypothetical protein
MVTVRNEANCANVTVPSQIIIAQWWQWDALDGMSGGQHHKLKRRKEQESKKKWNLRPVFQVTRSLKSFNALEKEFQATVACLFRRRRKVKNLTRMPLHAAGKCWEM